MDKGPLLSICIPTYNRVNTIEEQIAFFARQDMEDIEVIVSDNMSNDGTYEFVVKENEKHDWLKIRKNESNIGCDNNIRELLKEASGKYVWFLGDDIIREGWLDKIKNILLKNELTLLHLNYASTEDKDFSYAENERKYCPTNQSIRLTNDQIANLIKKELSGFMFMSANIYLRNAISEGIDLRPEYATTLLFSINALAKGNVYYTREVVILDDLVNITWTNRKLIVWFNAIPTIIDYTQKCGFTPSQRKCMLTRNYGYFLFCCNKELGATFKYIHGEKRLKECISIKVLFYFGYFLIKRVLKKLEGILKKE